MPVCSNYLFWPVCVDHFREAIYGCQLCEAETLRRVPDGMATWETEGRESGSESGTSQSRLRDRSGLGPLVLGPYDAERPPMLHHLPCLWVIV